jgi:hypothetical protein
MPPSNGSLLETCAQPVFRELLYTTEGFNPLDALDSHEQPAYCQPVCTPEGLGSLLAH